MPELGIHSFQFFNRGNVISQYVVEHHWNLGLRFFLGLLGPESGAEQGKGGCAGPRCKAKQYFHGCLHLYFANQFAELDDEVGCLLRPEGGPVDAKVVVGCGTPVPLGEEIVVPGAVTVALVYYVHRFVRGDAVAFADELDTGFHRSADEYVEGLQIPQDIVRGPSDEYGTALRGKVADGLALDAEQLGVAQHVAAVTVASEQVGKEETMLLLVAADKEFRAVAALFCGFGDEFVVVLDGRDYDMREQLLAKLREESVANKLSRSGPVVACGMAVFERDTDDSFDSVYKRADKRMYEHKKELKSTKIVDYFMEMNSMDIPISAERKRVLDSIFGALYTVIGEGYVYLNDMKHDFSRWSLLLVDDFGMKSEYMYHADKCWQEHIHPDDMKIYKDAIDAVLCGNAEVRPIRYRARRADGTYAVCHTRGFVLSDKDGNPEYFGGIIVTE